MSIALVITASLIAAQFVRLWLLKAVRSIDILCVFLLPPLLMWACFAARNPQSSPDQLRLLVLGAQLTGEESRAAPMRVGGDPSNDDLRVSGVPSGLMTVTSSAGTLNVTLHELGGDASAVVTMPSPFGPHILGDQPFGPGDQICLESCGHDGRWFQLSKDGRRLVEVGSSAKLPSFPERYILSSKQLGHINLLGNFIFPKMDQRIYPLRDFGIPEQDGSYRVDQPCGTRFLCLNDGNGSKSPARTFLYHSSQLPLAGAAMRIVLLDPGAQLKTRDGRTVGFSAALPGPPGRQMDFTIRTLQFADPETRPSDPDDPPSRVSEGVGVSLSSNARGLVASFDKPRVSVLERQSGVFQLQGASVPSRANVTVLSDLGGDLGRTVDGRLCLAGTDTSRCRTTALSVADGPGKHSCDQPRCGRLKLEFFPYPWFPMAVAAAWALVGAITFWSRWRAAASIVRIAAIMQLLLALRIIIGFEGAWLDPQLNWQAIVGGATVAYSAVPAFLLTLVTSSGPRGARRLSLAIFSMALAISEVIVYGRPQLLPSLFALSASVAPYLLDPFAARWPEAKARLSGALKRLLVSSSNRLAHMAASPSAQPVERKWSLAGVAVAGLSAAFVARLLIRLVGATERLPFPAPFDIAVSVFYLPALICGFALLIAAAPTPGWPADEKTREGLKGGGFLVFIALDVILAPLLMHDVGFAIYAIPLAAFGAIRAFDGVRAGRPRFVTATWLFPTIAIVALALSLVGYAQWSSRTVEGHLTAAEQASSDHDEEAAKEVSIVAENDQNQLRIFSTFAPDRLALAGTQWSETLRLWSEDLDDYTATFAGRGYLTASDLGELRDVQLSDNVSAIHIMSPFGRAGAAWFLAVLLLGALAYDGGFTGLSDWRAISGRLAVWTIVSSAAYMVLANLQLTPFTGRNIYWLASSSNSDLLEGAALFFLALWGASVGGERQ